MFVEKIYLDVFADEYKNAVAELINRMGWKMDIRGKIAAVTIPEKDIAIFGFIFDTI